MAFCLGQLADSGKGQEIQKKREWDDICQRFTAWFKLSTSQWHGTHLRPRGKQYVPDSYHWTDGVNRPLWKIHILQLARLHNNSFSNHLHHVSTCVELYHPKSNNSGKQPHVTVLFLTNPISNLSVKNFRTCLMFSYSQWLSNDKTDIVLYLSSYPPWAAIKAM